MNAPLPVNLPPQGSTPNSTGMATSATAPSGASESATASLNWSTIEEQSSANGVKVLVYGPAGVGKTVLCATLPQPIVFINSESGLLSLRADNLTRVFMANGMDEASAKVRAESAAKSPVLSVKNGLQLRAAFEWLANPKNHHLFKSIAWDSSSDTAEVILNIAKKTKSDPRQAYGDTAEIIADYFKKFQQIPGKHVCVTAKMSTLQDGVSGAMVNGPDFPGKQLGPSSPYWMDECFALRTAVDATTQRTFRYVQTQPDPSYTAKDRSGALDTVEIPDLTVLFQKMGQVV